MLLHDTHLSLHHLQHYTALAQKIALPTCNTKLQPRTASSNLHHCTEPITASIHQPPATHCTRVEHRYFNLQPCTAPMHNIPVLISSILVHPHATSLYQSAAMHPLQYQCNNLQHCTVDNRCINVKQDTAPTCNTAPSTSSIAMHPPATPLHQPPAQHCTHLQHRTINLQHSTAPT